jgi:hypothetical protein
VARTEENRNAYRVLMGKPANNRPLGRYIRRWKDNIKSEFKRKTIGRRGMDSSGSG